MAFVLVPAWTKQPREDLQANLVSDVRSNRPLVEPIITHEVNNPDEDPILNRIRQLGAAEGNVNIIYVPCYLNGNDGIFNMDYYEILAGLDATAFPSYYEPWGYTPLESVAFGVPTITTSLSGFGQWIMSSSKSDFEVSGVGVINRTDSNYNEVVNRLADGLRTLADASDEYCEKASKAARDTAERAEWSYFITYYIDAFRQAIEAADKRRGS